MTLPLFTTHPAGKARSDTATRVGVAAVLVGIAYVWLVPSAAAPRPPAWLVPRHWRG
jgi:hypothetical protein